MVELTQKQCGQISEKLNRRPLKRYNYKKYLREEVKLSCNFLTSNLRLENLLLPSFGTTLIAKFTLPNYSVLLYLCVKMRLEKSILFISIS